MKKTAPWTAAAIFLIAACALPVSAKPENHHNSAAPKAPATASQAPQGRASAKAPVLYVKRAAIFELPEAR